MSKVASAANIMGVGEDQLAAMLSTVISVTREAPETVGSALKTIFARINDIKAGVSEDGVQLGIFSGQMAEYGFNVLDANGHLRDMGEVIEEIGGKWEDLSREQQVSLAQIMGGKYQYSRLLSLFDNFDEYNKSLKIAQESAGTLQEQQDIYMESTAAHLQTLKGAVDNVYDSLLDTDSINNVADILTKLANTAATFIDSLGGGEAILSSLGAVAVNVFSNQIAKSINTTIANIQAGQDNIRQIEQGLTAVQQWQGIPGMDDFTKEVLKGKEELFQLAKTMTPEQFKGMQQLQEEVVKAGNALAEAREKASDLQEITDRVSKQEIQVIVKDKELQNNIVTEFQNQVNNYNKVIEGIGKAKDSLKAEVNNFIKDETKEVGATFSFEKTKEDIQDYLEKLNGLNAVNLEEHEQKIRDLQGILAKLPDAAGENVEQVLKDFQDLFDLMKEISEQNGGELEGTLDDLNQRFGELKKRSDEAESALHAQTEAQKRMQEAADVQKITKMAGSIAQIGSAINSVRNVGSIFTDDTLTNGEKFQQISANLTMTLPMLVTGVKSLGTALSLFSSSWGIAAGGIIGGLTAIISILGIYDSALKKNQEELKTYNKENIEKQQQKQAEIESNKELYSSLEELEEQYKKGEINRVDLKSTVEDLIKQYGIEGDAAQDLRNSYLNLSDAIERAKSSQADQLVSSTKREKESAKTNLVQAFAGERGIFGTGGLFGSDKNTRNFTFDLSWVPSQLDKQLRKELEKVDGAKIFEDAMSPGGKIQFGVDLTNQEDMISFYQNMEKVMETMEKLKQEGKVTDAELLNNDLYLQLKSTLGELSEAYNVYTDSVKKNQEAIKNQNIETAIKEVGFKKQNIQDASLYLENRAKIIEKLKEQNDKLTDFQAEEMADKYLEQNFSQLYNKYDQTSSFLEGLREKLGDIPANLRAVTDSLDDQQLAALLELDPDGISSWEEFEGILQKVAQIDFSNMTGLNADINAMQEAASDRFTFFQSLEDQVSSGKGVSKSTFKQLGEMLPEEDVERIKQYFDMMSNGTYKLTENAEQFYNLIDSFKLEGFYDTLDAIENKMNSINELSAKQFDYSSINSSALNQDTDFNNVNFGNFIDFDKLQQQIDYLDATNVVLDQQINNWRTLADEHTITATQVEEIANKVAEVGDQTQDLQGKTQALAQQTREVERAIYDAMFPLDADINESALQGLTQTIQELAPATQELADGLQRDARAAEDVAEAILRFDDAVLDVVDHYEEWKASLESGTIQDQAEAVVGLRDAYADLLDLDGDSLSTQFLTNADNLELMKAAIDGNIDAYDQLLFLAGQDIFFQVGLSYQDFESDLNSLLNEYYGIQDLDDIVIGTKLDDQQFLADLTNMANAAGLTAEQTKDALMSMGLDTEVIQVTDEAQQQDQIVGYTTTAEQVPGHAAIAYQDSSGMPRLAEYTETKTNFKTEPVIDTVTTNKEQKAFAVKVTSAERSAGGNFKFSQSKNGGGSAGTARRQAAVDKANSDAEKAAKQAERDAAAAARAAKTQADRQARAQKQAQDAAKREAEKAAKQRERAQKEWEKENSDTSQKDEKDLIKDERDLYHDINIEIKQVDRELEQVQKRQDRMYGKDLLKNLDKQTQILEKHKEKLREKQKIQEYDLTLQTNALKLLGVTFDAYNNISNYMDVVEAKQQRINDLTRQYNDLVALYNSSTNKTYKKGVADQMEALDKQIQDEKKGLTQLNTAIKNYDSLRDAMQDIEDDIEDETQKQIEIRIKQFRMELEIRLELGQAERDWNEFRRKVINHTDIIKNSDYKKIFADANTNFQDIMTYFNVGGQKGEIQKLTEQLNDTYSQVMAIKTIGSSTIYGDNMKQAMDDLKEDLGNLQDKLIEIKDLADEIDQAYLDTIDDVLEHFEEQIDDYEYVTDLIEHDMDLLDLLYGEKNYEAMDRYYETLKSNHYQELDFLRQESAMLKQQWERAVAEDGAESKTAKKFEQAYKESIVKIKEEIANTAKDLQSQFTNSIDAIWDELDRKLTNGKGLEYTELDWQLMNMNADDYLDTINAAYAIQELEGNFRKALNETNLKNVKAQKQIKALMDEQLANLRAKEKLTQYDVDRAQKLLEIEQARIALEDARSSKTSMQLRRDSQGNYSYEYVADQESIIDAQQNLAAAQNDLYNFDKDAYKSNLEDMLNAYKDYQEKHKELSDRAKNGDIEAQAELALVTEEYGQRMNDLVERNQNIRVNLRDSAFGEIAALYDTDVANYQNMSEQEQNILMNDLIPAWNSGIQEMSDKVAGEGGFIPTCEDAFDKIAETTRNYQSDLNSLAASAGVDLEEVRDGVDNVADSFRDLIDENEELIDVMGEELDAVGRLRQDVQGLTSDFNAEYQAAVKAVSAMQDFYRAQELQAAAEAAQYNNGGNGGDYSSTTTTTTSSSSSSGDSQVFYSDIDEDRSDMLTYGPPPVTEELAEEIAGNIWYHGDWGNNPTRKATMIQKWGDSEGLTLYGLVQSWFKWVNGQTHLTRSFPHDKWYYASYGPSAFDTGGYTGDWVGNGKIGILHQKEMVLNAVDTKNILDSVSIIRSMMKDLSGNIYSRLGNLNAGIRNPFSNNGDGLEQNVHIDASFPNVDSKREIEEALSDLVDLAAQRAMRR